MSTLRSVRCLRCRFSSATSPICSATPFGTDATAFGAIAGILTPYFESRLRQQTEKFGNLVAYVDRMMLRYYPEFRWAPLQQEAA